MARPSADQSAEDPRQGSWNRRAEWGGTWLEGGEHRDCLLWQSTKYDGLGFGTVAFNSLSGIGRSGTGVLKVDGQAVATQKMERTIPLILQWDENLDVGADTGTPVDDQVYQIPFRFTGKLNKVTLSIDRPKLSPEDEKKLMEAQRNNAASGVAPWGESASSIRGWPTRIRATAQSRPPGRRGSIRTLRGRRSP